MIRAYMGIELGSTRIKAVLIDDKHAVVAQQSYRWENSLENGIWTYPMETVWTGLREVTEKLLELPGGPVSVVCLGFSGMMHGYMPFDRHGKLLTPFRTWRNTMTGKASLELTALFGCNIPQRWSIAHLYQAVLSNEAHIHRIHHINTLAGYVHHRISGEFVVGINEASGMFPVSGGQYDEYRMEQFESLIADYRLPWKLKDVLPAVRAAGTYAGTLTEEGARLLDSTGRLKAGTPLAPPEGDAGTGMVATNTIAPYTGNVSAGTSIFSVTVLDEPLSRPYPEIAIEATPTGKPAAIVQCNNCTSDFDAWAATYREFCALAGTEMDDNALYTALYQEALQGDADCGGITVVGYLSGEHVTDFDRGCPLVLRSSTAKLTLANFLRAQLYSALASLAIGMRILASEHVPIRQLTGHGGFFKTRGVGQQLLADAVNASVSVMENAAEGGAYGMALLSAFRFRRDDGETLEHYLVTRVFMETKCSVLKPTEEGVKGFQTYLKRFEQALNVERKAITSNIGE